MFYIFSIFVCLGRIGRMGALIANYVMDEEMHTILSNEIDCLIQCSLAIVGLCLVVLMSQLYTYLQWNLIELEAAANRPRHQVIYYDMEAEGHKQSATKRFQVLKYFLHSLIGIAFVGTALQLFFIYFYSDFAG